MNAPVTTVRLRPSVRRFAVFGSLTIAILSFLLWAEGDFDRWFLLAHNPLRDDPAVAACAAVVSRFGMSFICVLLAASAAASYRSAALAEVRPALLVALFSFAAACLAGPLLKELLGRPRPMVELLGQLNAVSRHGSASFPSGHAAQSLALALPFILLVPAGRAARDSVTGTQFPYVICRLAPNCPTLYQ
jgi:membrane-associated phospholipid phosphatase